LATISGERTGWSRQEKQFESGTAYFLKAKGGGTSVFIAVRCIAATRAAGTVYEFYYYYYY
jgi:hypothetical protein